MCNGVPTSGSPCGRDISRWRWRKESQPKPAGIERSSPDGHRPQRPRVWNPSCGRMAAAPMHHTKCASGHLPLRSSVPSCWSRCLLQGLFHSLHVWSDWPKSTPPSIVSSLSQPCRYNKSNLLNPLNSLTQSAQTYSALMHHIDTGLQRKKIQNLSNVFKFYLLSGRLSGIHGKTLCEEHGERKWTSHHYSVRRQQTCFAKVVRNAPGSKDGLLGKFPERTQTVIFFAAI